MPRKIVVKRYRNEHQYQRDAQHMARKQYQVIDVVSQTPRRRLITVVALGFLPLLFARKPQLIVTYSHA